MQQPLDPHRTDTLCSSTPRFRFHRRAILPVDHGNEDGGIAQALAHDHAAQRRVQPVVAIIVAAEGPGLAARARAAILGRKTRSEEHPSELQSLMRISYAVFCMNTKKKTHDTTT